MNLPFTFTYLCPIRHTDVKPDEIQDLKNYWDRLSSLGGEILVVDGSPTHVFQVHKKEWINCRHIPVDSQHQFLNGKVNGIMTGILAANHDFIIMGDDDVRYEPEDIHRMLQRFRGSPYGKAAELF